MSEQQKKPTSKAQKIFYVFLAVVIIAPIFLATVYILETKDKMIAEVVEINKKREIAFAEMRPALMRYKDEQGMFPDVLNKLIPKYITSIPAVLLIEKNPNRGYDSEDMSVKYISDESSAVFRFRRGYVHTPMMTYDVLTGKYTEKSESVVPELEQ